MSIVVFEPFHHHIINVDWSTTVTIYITHVTQVGRRTLAKEKILVGTPMVDVEVESKCKLRYQTDLS